MDPDYYVILVIFLFVCRVPALQEMSNSKLLSRHVKQQNAHADSYQRGGGHSRKDDSYKYRDNRYFNSNRNQIVFTIYRLIWNQTDVCLIPNQSENSKYNLISV